MSLLTKELFRIIILIPVHSKWPVLCPVVTLTVGSQTQWNGNREHTEIRFRKETFGVKEVGTSPLLFTMDWISLCVSSFTPIRCVT